MVTIIVVISNKRVTRGNKSGVFIKTFQVIFDTYTCRSKRMKSKSLPTDLDL